MLPPVDDSPGPDSRETPDLDLFEFPLAELFFPETPAPVGRNAQRSGPPARPGQTPHPDLLRALIRRNMEEVREALEAEPDAARYPFWEHGAEPPLCAAVRLRCPAPIVQLLIQHGADASSVDIRGQSPIAMARRAIIRDERVEELLVEAGGDAFEACEADVGANGVAEDDNFPFGPHAWPDSGMDLPCAEGLPAPPGWDHM